MKPFESFLAPRMEQFLSYRHNTGHPTKIQKYHLKALDRALIEKNIAPGPLPPSFFLDFRANLKMEPQSANRVMAAIRTFFQYLVRLGDYRENPLADIPSLAEKEFIPFIFSPPTIDLFLAQVSKMIRPTPYFYLRDYSLFMALVLMARCGLRIAEPTRLRLGHYRPAEKTIYIENTKFKKSRLIPLPQAAAGEMENYLSVRMALLGKNHNPYLLAVNEKKGLNVDQIRKTFNQAVADIGIQVRKYLIGNTIFGSPIPHCLRHSFAVNTLKRIKEMGKSPQNALPVLAVYMGHCKYEHTTQYLKVLDAEQRQRLADFVISHQESL